MLKPDRLRSRMTDRALSQSELARRVGVSQATIYKLLVGETYGSKHLHRIARELETTPAYLIGEIDDPDEGAQAPPPRPSAQSLLLPVMLPSEDALAAAFQALLEVSRRMDEGELARELAKRLPTLLRVAGDTVVAPPAAALAAQSEAA